jgi:preprotein translocase subunit SecA
MQNESKNQKRLIMALRHLVYAADSSKVSKNEMLNKFVQDQLNALLHSSKLKEIIERVSLQENVSKEKALRGILEKMADETEQTAKKKMPSNILHAIN